ncbi:zinc finger BED domain-containing protein RICESLEEPER 2-like [Cucumis melo var. makuwa]|uniref:Zinc finger BED domain-containing protein RICESLEEPER 2-like n=1 Tax=Cucumis melo var. makuwa TaxID=1194695 RepID=A0A5A7UKW0_CUCMM|nr:zinc finger BED domain-containing protein RICESLEEPER 2-like [Cucumis melo var. makuwa]TYK12093.1 zinc finger BED domain-containing protein RICESLEEPER 2-like [Cucumis melo var. makuwa]
MELWGSTFSAAWRAFVVRQAERQGGGWEVAFSGFLIGVRMDSSSENASATGNNEMPPPPPNISQTTKHLPPLPPKSKRKRPNKKTSSVWDHFTKMEASANDGAKCKCNY